MTFLFRLQQEGALNYEITEEAFCFKILYEPNPLKVVEKITEIYDVINRKDMLAINKVEKSYFFPL